LFFSRNPFIFLQGDKPAAAVLASPQKALFLPVSYPANNIEIYLKTVSFTAMGADFRWHA
jgi:hypothetical protein